MRASGFVAIVLASGVALTLVVLAVAAGYAEAAKHLAISAEASTLLSTALGAAIGAVATYLGVHRSETTSDDDEPGDEESPRIGAAERPS